MLFAARLTHGPMARKSCLSLLRALAVSLVLTLAAGCGRGDNSALEIAIIGSSEGMFEDGTRLPSAGQHLRAATAEGLVTLNAEGHVIPALADRWIVTDDGRSYIFRLRSGTWSDGTELTADRAAYSLRGLVRQLRGTSMGHDLSQIDEIRAMAGRVVEIRLKGPMPDFLQLLAQPELGLRREEAGAGPMSMRRVGDAAVLSMMSPERRGLPITEGWQNYVRELRVHALSAADAIERFDEGSVDLVLNGRIQDLPLADTGPLSRGTVRLDPAIGLFGLMVARAEGFLAEAPGREAVSMAIDRDAMIAPFNVGGWNPTTRIVSPGMTADLGTIGERWQNMTLAQRRLAASQRVAAWRNANAASAASEEAGEQADQGRAGRPAVELSVELPPGPGSELLFTRLAEDLAAIGITLRRAEGDMPADLVLIDRAARYASALWFLNQFHCSLGRGLCSSEADARVDEAMATADPAERAALLAEAEAELTQANVFIPFGQPVRFSLVRSDITGYAANQWVFHPLPDLATIPR